MREALALARRARGRQRPNPMVGCVIVRAGRVLARGYHKRAGQDHAEVDALKKIGGRAPGATMYVTLEPCNGTGRVGPCSEAVIAAGVARVVCGMRDPNPKKSGGIERLRAVGVVVESGLLEAECRELNRVWLHWIETGRPLVTLKAAITLDGKLATRTGDSRWVSGEASRLEAHRLRAEHDAILVGAGTVRADDPQLTTRLPGRGQLDPQRVILDGKLSVPRAAKALPGAWVVTTRGAGGAELEARGAEIVRVKGRGDRVDLAALLDELGRRGVQRLLVEGGGAVHGQLLAAGLVDDVALFIAPKLLGSDGVPLIGVEGPRLMREAWQLEGVRVRRLGDDVYLRGSISRGSRG